MSYEDNERLDQLEEQIEETHAVLMLMEFVLEDVIANLLSDSSPHFSSVWRRTFVKEFFVPSMLKRDLTLLFAKVPPQSSDKILNRSIQLAEMFVKNVAAKEDAMREEKKKNSPPLAPDPAR